MKWICTYRCGASSSGKYKIQLDYNCAKLSGDTGDEMPLDDDSECNDIQRLNRYDIRDSLNYYKIEPQYSEAVL